MNKNNDVLRWFPLRLLGERGSVIQNAGRVWSGGKEGSCQVSRCHEQPSFVRQEYSTAAESTPASEWRGSSDSDSRTTRTTHWQVGYQKKSRIIEKASVLVLVRHVLVFCTIIISVLIKITERYLDSLSRAAVLRFNNASDHIQMPPCSGVKPPLSWAATSAPYPTRNCSTPT